MIKQTVNGGLLVVVEGLDGAGKSSVLQQLAGYCEEKGFSVILSREPTDGRWGKQIRASAMTGRLPLEAEFELFIRDREDHVENLILPALRKGSVVILDRYYFSSAAYQGARGLDPDEILARNEVFAPAPDLVLLLDCAAEVSLERIRKRGSVPDEFERLEALEAVRRIFLAIKRPFIQVVDAGKSAVEVAGDCQSHLDRVLRAKL
ncbi:MAG: dTMP kinase [Verrucomicrobiota bacterium]